MIIGCLINARLGSKRLPKKHLRDIGGKTAIERLLDRLMPCDKVTFILATGTAQENQPFLPIARQRKIEIFFGDPHNIPKRHLDCAKAYNLDAVISIDADDVLVSKPAFDAVLSMLGYGHQLCRTEGLPLGMNALWAYTTEYLKKSIQASDGNGSMETGWGHIFKDEPSRQHFKIADAGKIRSTLDYPEDLRFFRAVYDEIPNAEKLEDADLCREIIQRKIHRINRRWMTS